MSEPSTQSPEAGSEVSAAELRKHELPVQHFGGYSREATEHLLARAAKALEASNSSLHSRIARLEADLEAAHQQVSEQVMRGQPDEQAVGEALVTAHRVAEGVRAQAREEADALLAAARSEADELVQAAERRAGELRAESARIEEALGRAREEARTAEGAIAELRGEAERVRAVIEDFRTRWWTLISDSLAQLELRFPVSQGQDDGSGGFARDLRDRLVAARASDEPQGAETGSGEG